VRYRKLKTPPASEDVDGVFFTLSLPHLLTITSSPLFVPLRQNLLEASSICSGRSDGGTRDAKPVASQPSQVRNHLEMPERSTVAGVLLIHLFGEARCRNSVFWQWQPCRSHWQ